MNYLSEAWCRLKLRLSSLIGIRAKISGMAILLVVLSGSWITWRADSMTVSILKQQLVMRGVSIARDVAARSVDPVFTSNIYDLHRLVQDTLENNTDVTYLFIQDNQGKVLVHSFTEQGMPPQLRGFNQVEGDERYRLASFRSEHGVVHDIAVPVFEGRAGTVRLGMDESGLLAVTQQMTRSLHASIAIAFTIGVVIAYILASLLVVPLRHLIAGTRAIAEGNFSVRVKSWTKDEVGQLTEAFNLMAGKLGAYSDENTAATAELERKERLRIQLVERLIYAQEDERKRIARELHDETGQLLTAMKLGLKVISETSDPDQIRSVTEEMREILSLTLDEVSALARDLRPSVLDDMGLHAALSRYVEMCSSWVDKKIAFKSTGLKEYRFPFYVETAVYRIVQEALNNMRKYAMARNISVTVSYKNDILTAIVKDDGVGFSPDDVLDGSKRTGLGLFGMQERAALIGGELIIKSAPCEGTTITLRVPWRREEVESKTDKYNAG
jgi:signal transduction histidine kinase